MSDNLFRVIMFAFFGGIGTGIGTAIGSLITTGEFTKWFADNPILIVILPIVIGGSIIGMVIQKRSKRGYSSVVKSNIFTSWFHASTLEYNGVLWDVDSTSGQLTKNVDILVRIPPKCKICHTELEQKKNFRGYTWGCLRCHSKIKNGRNFDREAEIFEKILKGDIDRYFSTQNR